MHNAHILTGIRDYYMGRKQAIFDTSEVLTLSTETETCTEYQIRINISIVVEDVALVFASFQASFHRISFLFLFFLSVFIHT